MHAVALPGSSNGIACRAAELFDAHQQSLFRRTDRLFAGLLVFEWLAGVAAALYISPTAWAGLTSQTHPHVWQALLLGGASISVPLFLALVHPGHVLTRHAVAVGQMLLSALLIHLTGGRIETHFHVFGSLAFLAFYRDWRVLVTASVVVAADHLLRGVFWPQSVYGILMDQGWRWLEHAGWVAFEDAFLIPACLRGVAEMRAIAERQATLEALNAGFEAEVRRRTEQLRESEARLRTVVTNAPVTLFALDREGCFTLAEGRGLQTLGPVAGDVVGRSVGEACRDVPQIGADVQRALTGESFTTLVKTGTLVFETHYTPLRDEASAITGVIGVATDVTEQKQLESQMLRAQRLEGLGTLAGGIAHDLNNVLTPMLMASQLLTFRNKDPQNQPLLQAIDSGVQRATEMVKQILSFARGAEGNHEPLALGDVVVEVERMLRRTLPKAIEVEVALARELSLVRGDRTQLYQVLMNLCVNARDAMPAGGQLTIAADNVVLDEAYTRLHLEAKPGLYVALAVTDSGTGIPPEIQERIFDPFFTTKGVGKGTGLGLSTVAGIIKSHGGFSNVYSELGRGTRFVVYLPALKEGSQVMNTTEAVKLPTGDGEVVLVVDDEAPIRAILRETLEAQGYRVLTAEHGMEALAIYAERGPEIGVVLTDWMMPQMDGPTTIRELQRLNPAVRIIAASGLTAGKKPAEVPGVGAFLTKPYRPDQLLRTLQDVCR